jgi:lipoate-protein ligase A
VQVDPIKPTLKAPGTKRLKLKYDDPLSNFAFKFNLRRYTMEWVSGEARYHCLLMVYPNTPCTSIPCPPLTPPR